MPGARVVAERGKVSWVLAASLKSVFGCLLSSVMAQNILWWDGWWWEREE